MDHLTTQLQELESAQLIRRALDEDLSFLFRHALTQETAYESLLVKKRRAVHLRVAQAYERLYPEGQDENAALLAAHFAEAGEDGKVLEYATRAGDAAARIYANAEAAAHYALALSAAERIDASPPAMQELFLKRGRALELLSRFDEAARCYDQMQQAARVRGDRGFELAALVARATIRAIPGSARDPDQARALAALALPLARELGDRPAEARIHWIVLLANIYWGGSVDEAIEHGQVSLDIARELGLREQIAYSLQDLSTAYLFLGRLDEARQLRLEAAGLWRELHNLPALAENITGLGLASYLLGEHQDAVASAREGYLIGRDIGDLGSQGFAGIILTLAHIQLGELGEALSALDEAVPVADQGALEGNGLSIHGLRAWILAICGQVEEARGLVREAYSRPSAQLPVQQLYLDALTMRIELLAGRTAEAERILNEGRVRPGVWPSEPLFPGSVPIPFLASEELVLAQGDFARALALQDELLDHLKRLGTRTDRSLALWQRGVALAGMNRRDEAREAWETARAEAEPRSERLVLWRVLASLAQAEQTCGRVNEARRLYSEASEVLRYLAEHMPAPCREPFLNTTEVKRVMNAAD